MSLVPDSRHNIRLDQPDTPQPDDGMGIDVPGFDDDGPILRIEHEDGSITLSLDGKPLDADRDEAPSGWFDNLAEKMDETDLALVADRLLRGVEDDLTSRQEWIEERAQGIKLLGLKIEVPSIDGAADGAPVEGMSRVRHPLLQEAVLRFQANARSEMLPADGPVKVRNDENTTNFQIDELADDLQRDFNHYLTAVASEYYPDTDRMFLLLGFGGTSFKKVYFCPLRNRPVSETVDADDLIVNMSATDLANARRVTHRTYVKPSTVRRLQLLGAYRDISLGDARMPNKDAVQDAKEAQQGITSGGESPEDRDREIYEIYCELDLPGFEHKIRGRETGLEIPYRVTIDVSSREVLSIVRNYDKVDDEFPTARETFVKYDYVPGFGFYGIGLLHILGNTTNAITAASRELLDAGMFSNFPGVLMSKGLARQNSNILRVPPGGAAQIDTNGMPIQQAVMPLPYKEPSQALMALVQYLAETGQRVGSTSEMATGEGRADVPVGTMLAMIEQQTKILNSVHKRMHTAQAKEFQLLAQCFRDNPGSFWQRNKRPARQWDEQTFRTALDSYVFVPQSDPNTASHTQRLMKVMALKQLAASNPTLYDPVAVDKAALMAIGWNNPEQFLASPEQRSQPTPEIQKGIADIQIAKQKADADMLEAKSKAQLAMAQAQQIMRGPQSDPSLGLKAEQLQFQKHKLAVDNENRDLDREASLRLEQMKLAHDRETQGLDHAHDAALAALSRIIGNGG